MDTEHGGAGLPAASPSASWQYGCLLGSRISQDGRVRLSLSSAPTVSLLLLVGMFHP